METITTESISNHFWKNVLKYVQKAKEKNYKIAWYYVYLKSGHFIVNTKDQDFEQIDLKDGILTVRGYQYPKGTRLTHLHEYEMSQEVPSDYIIPFDNIDYMSIF